ncbi:MAG: signal peptidase I [Verrucomicrobiota bacterium]
MKLRWLLSSADREAVEMCKHVRKLFNAQRDFLSTQATDAVNSALAETQKAIDDGVDKKTLRKRVGNLETAANKWIKPYPNAKWRENVEVFLVAIAVAMAIRTFFLQPFKIPTGSLQPTLYGIEFEPLQATSNKPEEKIPNAFGKIWDAAVGGTFYHFRQAEADGEVVKVDQPRRFLFFLKKQTVWVKYNGRDQAPHTIWFAPEQDPKKDNKFLRLAELYPGRTFQKGDYIFQVKEIAGDHLFVNRITYNFRPPTRGEIIIFKTKGINHPYVPQDEFYIKRLVALSGDKVSIGDDQHLRINGVRLDAATPHFGNVYIFSPDWQENHYFGHVNGTVEQKLILAGVLQQGGLAPYFPDQETVFEVPATGFMALGDNTLNSLDSRGWGAFPRDNVIAKSFFVYWPIANHGESRFGWAHTAK